MGDVDLIFPRVAERLPDGIGWHYKVAIAGGRTKHEWALRGPRGGIHVSAWMSRGMSWGDEWSGGIECHSPVAQSEYDEKRGPSHEHCWLLCGPCWHDGSSLQFSEQIAPYLPPNGAEIGEREHLMVLGIMLSRYDIWLPAADDEAEGNTGKAVAS